MTCMSSPGRGPSTGWESRRGAPEETQALWRAPRSRWAAASMSVSYTHLYFHVPCRDTVVTCQVPPDIWYYLSKGDRGTLCHQGGRFISFTRDGELIAVDPVAERHQLWRIHGS